MTANKQIEFHEVANIFPMMTAVEIDSLKQDIATNGLREPIWLYNDRIIDGRNRYIACLESGVTPIFRNYEGQEESLLDFVISLNLHRRHLNTSQKACLAVEILPQLEKSTKENLSKKMSAIRKGETEDSAILQNLNSSQKASKIFGVSERYIFDAKKLSKDSAMLFTEVLEGKLSLQQAKKQLKQSEVSAILQKPESKPETNAVVLSKIDLKKINEFVSEFGISEQKAREYIIKQKTKRMPKTPSKSKGDFKEVKVRIPQVDKDKLQLVAKQRHITVSELLRELLSKNVL